MKRISFFLLFLLALNASAQKNAAPIIPVSLPTDSITKLFTYEGVVQTQGTSRDVLYKRAMEWCHSYFKNPTEVIRENDDVKGVIICKPRFRISNPPDKNGLKTDAGLVQYTLTIAVKDGRYKYELTAFNWKQLSYYAAERWIDTKAPGYTPAYNTYLTQIDEYVREFLKSFKPAMATDKAVKDKDNW